jgi:hypothetical protein
MTFNELAEKNPNLPVGIVVLVRKALKKQLSEHDRILAYAFADETWNKYSFVRAIGGGNFLPDRINQVNNYCLELAKKEFPEVIEYLKGENNDEN